MSASRQAASEGWVDVIPMTTPERTQEIEVELRNEPGTLAEASQAIADQGVNILGFTCLAQGEKGTACFIADDPAKATQALEKMGLNPRTNEVLFAPLPNEPGQLSSIAGRLGESGVNIERTFVTTDPTGQELGVGFSVDDLSTAEKVIRG